MNVPFLNIELAKNPVNYLVVASMAAIGLLFLSILTAPLRAAKTAQTEAQQ